LTALIAAAVILLAACDVGSSPAATAPDVSLGPARSGGATGTPGSSGAAGATPLPGFEDWALINPQAVSMDLVDGRLQMTLTKRALWFQNQRGVLFYQLIKGDFRVSASVETTKTSSPGDPPGGDGTAQLAGLMARADEPRENYLFVVVGDDGNGVSVETKSTTNDQSKFEGPAWPEPAADLKLCRQGSTFTLQKRGYSTDDDWQTAATFKRPDLPETLQVGANIYSDSAPDIVARFDGLVVESLDPGEAC